MYPSQSDMVKREEADTTAQNNQNNNDHPTLAGTDTTADFSETFPIISGVEGASICIGVVSGGTVGIDVAGAGITAGCVVSEAETISGSVLGNGSGAEVGNGNPGSSSSSSSSSVYEFETELDVFFKKGSTCP
jgi:hypothetical protein